MAYSAEFCQGKKAWPELLGMDGEAARIIILKENPLIIWAKIIPLNRIVTMDYICRRVWIRVDCQGKVAKVPVIG
ncbi:glu S.griseus protease inhibitor-like [Amaranthus tricolor]|uniref:glu S.griseus protease inhibitor-like n=1 Tax=Amaranthus tricolor TaxID=29722 RepID=UPI002586F77C|nr:glu S.griseus protease inhibitor-like [Amaranthus tricolor]